MSLTKFLHMLLEFIVFIHNKYFEIETDLGQPEYNLVYILF